jgi:hypothetical protein
MLCVKVSCECDGRTVRADDGTATKSGSIPERARRLGRSWSHESADGVASLVEINSRSPSSEPESACVLYRTDSGKEESGDV